MTLDHLGHDVPPSVPLVRELCDAGAYVRHGDTVKGLIYAPFAEYVTGRWGLAAQVEPDLPVHGIRQAVTGGRLVIISVHKTIRTLPSGSPGRGGHLVLAVGVTDHAVVIHNPSGLPGASQEFHHVPWGRLGDFYAGRGVILGG